MPLPSIALALPPPYRGRLAPTPSGRLHRGHGRTFTLAWARARHAGGQLFLRLEDLDGPRCRPEYVEGILADLAWLGLTCDPFPGHAGLWRQSQRLGYFAEGWARLRDAGAIYPSPHSRADVARCLSAPHEGESEPIYPPALRPPLGTGLAEATPGEVNWRFRVPDGEVIAFDDALAGPQRFVAGRDFGDFLVWRRDGFPSYELAVVADDHAQGITEVVRGQDLLLSTARQLLLYRALGWSPPAWCHAPLVRDTTGQRLAKRAPGESLADWQAAGADPAALRAQWLAELGHPAPTCASL